jgi:glycosyltransferase involved in cell wall biosynthesis
MKVWFPTVKTGSGSDVYTERLAKSLQIYGVDTEITWFSKMYEPVPYFLKNKLPPQGTDIIHANSWTGFIFKKHGIPLVITEHHCVLDPLNSSYKSLSQNMYHRFFIKRFELASFSAADAIISVSKFTSESIARAFGLLSSTVIYNYVDTDIFKPSASYSPPNNTCLTLLNVGNFSKRKGIDILLALAQRLGSNYRLYLTGGLRPSSRLKLPDNVILTGQLIESKLVELYQQCDALVFPSRLEGFGYAAAEAMACGKPVICANNSALSELVVNGKTGYLCNPDDINCYFDACQNLRNNPKLLLEMGKRSRQRAVQMFNGEDSVPKYVKLYNSLITSRKK